MSDEIDIKRMKEYIQDIRATRTNLIHRETSARHAYETELREIEALVLANRARCPHISTSSYDMGTDSSSKGGNCTDCGKEW